MNGCYRWLACLAWAILLLASCINAQPLLNLQTSAFEDLAYSVDGRFAVFLSPESNGGSDLNADADIDDLIPHLYDAVNGQIRVIPIAAALSATDRREHGLSQGYFLFAASEADQGTDLNGDGDLDDDVLHLIAARTGMLHNLGLARTERDSIQVHLDLMSCLVSEEAQGMTDLNGDGDAFDSIVHILHPETQTVINTGLSTERVPPGDQVTFPAGSGRIIHVFDRGTGQMINLGLAGDVGPCTGQRIAFEVWETIQGLDLNGDGDVLDRVAHTYDTDGAFTFNLQVATARIPSTRGNQIVISVSESGQLTDFNGDGDTLDDVPHVYGTGGSILRNLGFAESGPPALGELGAVFAAFEEDHGNQDLNGDGDATDFVYHTLCFASGTLTNTRISGISFRGFSGAIVSGNRFAGIVREIWEGQTDLNGDGDIEDEILYFGTLDGMTSPENSRFAVSGAVSITNSTALFSVSETAQGSTDLNGDGDSTDRIPHFRSFATGGSTMNLQRATSFTNALGSELAFMPILEQGEGRDLNGDSDLDDAIVHVIRMPSVQSCREGTVNLGAGAVADVLRINGETGDVTASTSSPLELTLSASPMGPAKPRYLLWAWRQGPTSSYDVQSSGGALLGCTVNPTPAMTFALPRPFRCLGTGALMMRGCQGVPALPGPGRGPVVLMSPGTSRPLQITFQGLIEDSGAANVKGFSVTNAVVLSIE